MKERKYIDRIYFEKFKDFEATPNEEVWRSISAQLQEKERRRRIISPWWYRAAGAAAALALAFLLRNSPISTSTPVVDSEINIEKEDFQPEIPILPSVKNNIAASTSEEENKAAVYPKMAKTEEIFVSSASTEANIVPDALVSSISAKGLAKSGILNMERQIFPEISSKENILAEKGNKKSIFEEISLANEIEDIQKEQFQSKFEVSTHAAPIYYGNMGSGNFIDPMFADNDSHGEITFSYGVNLTYSITEKFRIRSGINKVAMSYNTNGIAYHAVINPTSIGSIDYKNDDIRLIDETQSATKGTPAPETYRVSVGSVNPGSMNQRSGYIEVPVELEFNILDSRFGINLIGGASTLFLDENIISVTSGSTTTDLGKANNLNTVSFSTNIGLGLDYKLSDKFNLNFEPIFKYQINTFDAASAEFQPYYLGIYSGFSYKF